MTNVYEGSTSIFRDTLKVEISNHVFYHIDIQIKNKNGNWFGEGMRYINYNSYGYYSGVSFLKDSIFYNQNVPMGAYFTNMYKGKKIKL